MSRKQDEYNGAIRLFEALSSVDEELLERSSVSRKVIPFWRTSKVLAVCACFILMGVVTWYGSRIFLTKGSVDCAATESSMNTSAEDGGYREDAMVEDAVAENAAAKEAEQEEAANDMDMLETEITDDVANKEELYVSGSTPIALAEQKLSEEELRAVTELGNYVPDVIS